VIFLETTKLAIFPVKNICGACRYHQVSIENQSYDDNSCNMQLMPRSCHAADRACVQSFVVSSLGRLNRAYKYLLGTVPVAQLLPTTTEESLGIFGPPG
jgi:hypothetical protein